MTSTETPSTAKLLIASLLVLSASYIFASLAIDRGSWLYYVAATIGLTYAIRHLRNATSGRRPRNVNKLQDHDQARTA